MRYTSFSGFPCESQFPVYRVFRKVDEDNLNQAIAPRKRRSVEPFSWSRILNAGRLSGRNPRIVVSGHLSEMRQVTTFEARSDDKENSRAAIWKEPAEVVPV